MSKTLIKFTAINDITNFVNTVCRYKPDMTIISGQYQIDAKSIMGIVSMDHAKPVKFVINSEDKNEVDEILNALKKWEFRESMVTTD